MYRRQPVRRTLLTVITVLTMAPATISAQSPEPVDNAIVAKIREEAFNRSQVMNVMSYLTDVSGPRLTGSPNTRKAAEWTMAEMKKWGLTNPRLESWGPFGRGWTNDKFYAQVTAPVPFPVIGYPQAWTPGTNGLVKSEVVYVKINADSDFTKYKGQLKGKIVMLSPMREVRPNSLHWARAGLMKTWSAWRTHRCRRRPEPVDVAAPVVAVPHRLHQ